MKKVIIIAAVVAVVALAIYGIRTYLANRVYNDPAFAHGNGRIEATDVNITTKFSERVAEIKVHEGDLVKKGQVLAVMQTASLRAQLAQAQARKAQAEAELDTAKANVAQKESTFRGNQRRYERAKTLLKDNAVSQQQYENDETLYLTSKSELQGARAGVKTAEANIKAAEADIAKIEVDLHDCVLTAPLDGRIQFRIAEPGEVLGAGGKVLSLVDLTDVYMTFFLPEEIAGKVRIGAEARILLDAAPDMPIPAEITFVSSVAQFTPKTVETQVERQKLMFRIKAHIPSNLLKKYIDYVKTGLPGVTWVKVDPNAEWPDFLKTRVEKGKKPIIAPGTANPAAPAPATPAPAKAPVKK